MLVIDRVQMTALQQRQRSAFAEEMVDHLFAFAPQHAGRVGRERMARLVDDGYKRAEGYGFDRVGTVRLFLELQVLLGHRFDRDPQYRRLARWLDPAAGPQALRADRLHADCLHLIDSVYGPDAVFSRRALRILSALVQGAVATPEAAAWPDRVAEIWPEKHAYVGDAALRALQAEAGTGAAALGLPGSRGTALMFAMMIGFGQGIVSDPQFAWLIRAEPQADPAERGRRLEARLVAYVAVMAKSAQGTADADT